MGGAVVCIPTILACSLLVAPSSAAAQSADTSNEPRTAAPDKAPAQPPVSDATIDDALREYSESQEPPELLSLFQRELLVTNLQEDGMESRWGGSLLVDAAIAPLKGERSSVAASYSFWLGLLSGDEPVVHIRGGVGFAIWRPRISIVPTTGLGLDLNTTLRDDDGSQELRLPFFWFVGTHLRLTLSHRYRLEGGVSYMLQTGADGRRGDLTLVRLGETRVSAGLHIISNGLARLLGVGGGVVF